MLFAHGEGVVVIWCLGWLTIIYVLGCLQSFSKLESVPSSTGGPCNSE